MVSSPVCGTSVCWKKSLGCRMKFPITTWEICSAQSSSSLAGRVLSQESHCLCHCSWDMQKHSLPHASSASWWPAVWLAHVKLWCVLLFLVLIKKHFEKYLPCSSCILCVGFLFVCFFPGGMEAWHFTGLKSSFPGRFVRMLCPLPGSSVFQGDRILICSRFVSV